MFTLVAKLHIIGDVLIAEESIVACIHGDVHWNFCNLCFNHCYTLIPCTNCGDVSFLFKAQISNN